MTEKHIADGEETFVILNVPPDFCEIDDDVVPFDIVQTLKPEQSDYAKTVFARNEPVLMVSSVIKGVIGNAGAGVTSTVSMGAGYSEVCPNESTIVIEGRNAARHLDFVWMNGHL